MPVTRTLVFLSVKSYSIVLNKQVADEKFCETTIGCRDVMLAPMMRDIIQTEYFRVVVVDDEDAVEICGALKVCYVISLSHDIIQLVGDNFRKIRFYFFISI